MQMVLPYTPYKVTPFGWCCSCTFNVHLFTCYSLFYL